MEVAGMAAFFIGTKEKAPVMGGACYRPVVIQRLCAFHDYGMDVWSILRPYMECCP